MTLWSLFWRFFFIGLFTIGGGQVAITLMYQELVESGIISADLFYNMLAVSESTPGPIGINMATYLGTEMFGIAGGLITTLGTVSPSIIVIVIIARFFTRMQDTLAVKSFFSVLRPAAAGLVAIAAWNVFKISVVLLNKSEQSGLWYDALEFPRIAAWLIFTLMLFKTKLPAILYIVFGALFGLIFI
ncbi:chromate transporter [Treponema sp. HNW]|uniref:chromate transporter n=1 Tax=Treponema sp. HNW TaxID=3116654 RepID=UPI003D10D0D2